MLRLLQAEDVPAFAAYRSDPDVARYQSWDTSFTTADGERLLASQLGVEFGDPGSWVQVAAIERATGARCGDCGVLVVTDQPRTAEVGVTFAPASQGSGLATEAVGAVVGRLFEHHDIHRVFARRMTATTQSIASSSGWGSSARHDTSTRTGSRPSGRRCASTRSCGANGGSVVVGALDRPTAASTRGLARTAGLLFILTFVSAIAGDLLYNPVLDDPDYIVGAGDDTRIALGAVCELVLIIANIGTALVLFPVLRLQNEGLALGYVAARIVECVFIAVGILSVLAIVTLRQEPGGADDDSLVAIGQSLVAIKDWTFRLGPGFVVGVGNGLILGYLMYRSGLVPGGMAVLGLIGGPLVCASGIAIVLGWIEQGSAWQGIATIPEIAWEASLGIYLTFKGFKASSPLFGSGSA